MRHGLASRTGTYRINFRIMFEVLMAYRTCAFTFEINNLLRFLNILLLFRIINIKSSNSMTGLSPFGLRASLIFNARRRINRSEVRDDWNSILNRFSSSLCPSQPGFMDILVEESDIEGPSRERGDAKQEVEI
jgi:hypothetical protein